MFQRTTWVVMALVLGIASIPAEAQKDATPGLDDLAWIAGTWEGLGPDDYGGTQRALAIWTAPLEGTMSWTFRWHTPENGHVHFAFTVLEETDDGVFSRGIHHGPDFEPYEDAHWVFRMTAAGETRVTFQCVENCRARSLILELDEDGLLFEKYQPLDEAKPLSIFKYERVKSIPTRP